jgi:putative chitinase
MSLISQAQLEAICPRLKNAEVWIPALNAAMEGAYIDTPARIARFIAQAAHESDGFTALEENLNYGPAALIKTFPAYFTAAEASVYGYRPEKIANRVYGGRMGNGPEHTGHGYLYRARGFGVTGRDNYRRCSIAICGDADTLLINPELLSEPDYACMSFAWYWGEHNLNELADRHDFEGISDVISIGHVTKKQGDSNGFASRLAYLKRATEVFA